MNMPQFFSLSLNLFKFFCPVLEFHEKFKIFSVYRTFLLHYLEERILYLSKSPIFLDLPIPFNKKLSKTGFPGNIQLSNIKCQICNCRFFWFRHSKENWVYESEGRRHAVWLAKH